MIFHPYQGRDEPDEELDDWGYDGPEIEGVEVVHTTYAEHIRVMFSTRKDLEEAVEKIDGLVMADVRAQDGRHSHYEIEFWVHEGLLKVGDSYYGDWTVRANDRS